ncbi:MAG: permease-like cell division protein FtsX [Paludibacteraceae bacterium]|nr:permease-like cell division protein FtsX [Paludibacteraceae bacterium]
MSRRRHRFFNTYLTATISVALVLTLVGMESVIGLGASHLLKQLKETTMVTMVLSDETTSADSLRVVRMLEASPFCRSYEYISKERALAEHVADLGEDPTEFLGYNPIRASFEVKLASDYVQQDSIEQVEKLLSKYEFVESVNYPRMVVSFFSRNIGTVTLILLGIAVILLVISIALVVNTIRLTVYARRFSIQTMKLVGATPWIIKGPIVGKSVRMGLWAGIIALVFLSGVLYYVHYSLGFWALPLTWVNIAVVCGVVILSGIILTFFASVFAVNRYIRMKTDDLYFV